MMPDTTERCPWCDSVISRSKFVQIEATIREQEQSKLAQAEKQLRLRLETQHSADLAKQRQTQETSLKSEAAKQLAITTAELTNQRNTLSQQLKDAHARETTLRSSVQQQAEAMLKELADQRAALEKDRDESVLKVQADYNRERESFQKKIKEMERQLLKKTSQDVGEGAEIDLFEAVREAFPDDRISRVQKGQPGADIHHEVMYKGQSCGKIVIDSKNRQAWQNGFVTKLRQDQTEAGAEHAILSSTVFPSGKKELCIESDVIVVSPARVRHVISLLRRTMITVHVRGLTLTERATKMTKLYNLITSEAYAQRFGELEKLTTDILDLDVQEKKSHDTVWRKRGILATRMTGVLREIDTEVAAVVEGYDQKDLSVAS